MTHLISSYLPVLALLPMWGYFIRLMVKKERGGYKAKRILAVSLGILTTITCGLGGSGMRRAEAMPGISMRDIAIHAWAGALAFILSVVILIMSYRKKNKEENSLKRWILLLSFYTLFYILSLLSGANIFA